MMPVYYNLPANLAEDIEVYQSEVNRFLAGEIPAAVLRAKRVPRGVYEQRKDGTFMVRVRVAGGTLNCRQMEELAELSKMFGNGLLHITTRQDIQLHDVLIENTPAVMRRLLTVGLTSKGGGGNTVRNVTVCPYAGICPAERFDVTPCAHAVTEYLISLVGSYNLPRKFKIAFSGCQADCAFAQVTDLGFIAQVRDGKPGFKVLAGGGMGAKSRIADILLDWSAATDIIRISETVRRLFDQLGDRSNKHTARLRFVFDRIGAAEFRRRFIERLSEVAGNDVPEFLKELPLNENASDNVLHPPHQEIREGIRVFRQRQTGYVAVPVYAPLGFLPAEDFKRIGELASQFSKEGGIRTTIAQNLLIRYVKEEDLPDLVHQLKALKTDVITPRPLNRFVVCAGASTCRLGICLSREAARACAEALERDGVSWETIAATQFYINGCPNACGQQPIGPIGFYGVAQRWNDRLVPSYTITMGGRCGVEGARLGTIIGKIPARALPEFVLDLAADFQSRRLPGESFLQYFDRIGIEHFKSIAERHSTIPDYSISPEFYRDFGSQEEFSLAGRGAGECGAGVFDLIQEDLKTARTATDPFTILLACARALLITRGVDACQPDNVLREFERHFIESGLVSEEVRPLIARARGYIEGWKSALDGMENSIIRLRERIELLYSTLDANLQFHPEKFQTKTAAHPVQPSTEVKTADSPSADVSSELDLRGVRCPINFVKAKLKLETLNIGDKLAIVLDDGEPIQNVPASLKNEGQEVIEITNLDGRHWRVIVRRKK